MMKCKPPVARRASIAGQRGSAAPVSLGWPTPALTLTCGIWDNVTSNLPHEGCGSKFVVIFYVALNRPQRPDYARQTAAANGANEPPLSQQRNRLTSQLNHGPFAPIHVRLGQ